MTASVSVVVPCRNAAAHLGEQLQALSAQRYGGPWEVVVVDDGSTDGSAALAERFRSRLPRLRVVRNPEPRNASRARNIGVAAATGQLLLFCDADDVVCTGWVDAMVRALGSHAIVGGASEVERLNPRWAVGTRDLPQQHGLQSSDIPGWDLVHGGPGNLGVTRALWENVGPFDEDDGVARQEGVDYFFRAQLAGFEPGFAPDAVISIRLRHTFPGVYRQARGWAMGSVAIQRKYAPLGLTAPPAWRGVVSWGWVPIRLLAVRDRGQLARWLHLLGWRVGRLRGSLRERTFAL